MHPAVICVAPTGARRTKSDHPALPIAPAEIAREAAACAEAGAHVVHVHVRDAAGNHVLDAAAYRNVIAAIRAAAGDALVIQVTTEAVGRYSRHEQMALVRELRPEAVSIALRELTPDAASEEEALEFLAWCGNAGVAVQHIVYDAADAARLVRLASDGHPAFRPSNEPGSSVASGGPAASGSPRASAAPVASGSSRKDPHALFVLGRYATGQRATPTDLLPFLEQWPTSWPWTVCAFGPNEAACLADALTLGGHVRVGFENNVQRPDGTLAAGNAEQVARVRELAIRGRRRLATTEDVKAIYGLTR
jgi:3-keto-5-aminohexanoate cleavage enzyme